MNTAIPEPIFAIINIERIKKFKQNLIQEEEENKRREKLVDFWNKATFPKEMSIIREYLAITRLPNLERPPLGTSLQIPFIIPGFNKCILWVICTHRGRTSAAPDFVLDQNWKNFLVDHGSVKMASFDTLNDALYCMYNMEYEIK